LTKNRNSFPEPIIFHQRGKAITLQVQHRFAPVHRLWKAVDKPLALTLPKKEESILSTNPQP